MKLTNIKQQIKRADRYSLFFDEKYAFSLSEAELLALDLSVGQEFSEEEVAALKQKAVIDKAYDRALNLIARRRRSEWELQQYLARKDYEPDVIDQVLKRLIIKGYVDDLAFAQAWVDNRRLLKSVSKLRLKQELRQKRISDEVIDRVISEDEADDRSVLKDLATKKIQQSRYKDPKKLMSYLSRQGFKYDDIKSVIEEIS